MNNNNKYNDNQQENRHAAGSINQNMRDNLENINQDIYKGVRKGTDMLYNTSELIKGLVSMAVGVILFTYSAFGWFAAILSPVLALTGAALVFWGGLTSDLYGRIKSFGQYFDKK